MLELFHLLSEYHRVVGYVLPCVYSMPVYGWVERVTSGLLGVCLGCKGCDWDVWVCLGYMGCFGIFPVWGWDIW